MSEALKYNHLEIEPKWQRVWLERKPFAPEETTSGKPKKYILDMFPYPSGAGLHVGHPESYTATDICCRYSRMRGFNVLHPMGWDAFGLPAEQHAIETGTHPAVTTRKNIDTFRRQIRMLGFSYDWEREVDTTDPAYFKWTQWIFLQLYKRGLAYMAEVPVWWCEGCKAVLANEEVKDGRCDRKGHENIVRRPMRQWMLKITAYADRLLDDLAHVEWSDSIKEMQRNWIGRSEGAEVDFTIADGTARGAKLRVYTTRPDTLYGATYMVLAPEHPLVDALTTDAQRSAVTAYRAAAARKSELDRTDLAKDKTGVPTGGYAVNPVNDERIPVWIADYVLISYGTGAIMAVPAHDERDFAFAKTFGLDIRTVVQPPAGIDPHGFTGDGVSVNSGMITGLSTPQAKKKITAWLEERGLGARAVNYRLRDWLFSRQRYWGEPIPVVHCPACGVVPLPESALPLTLPELEDYTPPSTAEPPLAKAAEWVKTTCPSCGGPAERETNTMPQWAGSCWYYLRYIDPRNDSQFIDPAKERYWMPVDLYIGGAEHAVLHLLYARFWHKVLYDLGHVSTPEPFTKLVNQGMILGEDGEKMSKSRGNVINPDDVVTQYGADTLRLYEMFMGPLEQTKPWNMNGVEGVYRFLQRVWRLAHAPRAAAQDHAVERQRHKMLKKVTDDIEALHFNTAISAMMIFVNEATEKGATRADIDALVLALSPFAPHLAEEIWEMAGHTGLVCQQAWPAYDPALVQDDSVEFVVQVNGKVRGRLVLPVNMPEADAIARAMADPAVARWLEGRTVVKRIFVPDKLLNIVVKQP
ncbi:leucine--tRNA ligase [bacterium]|nr:leucine--tRNA ligase [bacterium]